QQRRRGPAQLHPGRDPVGAVRHRHRQDPAHPSRRDAPQAPPTRAGERRPGDVEDDAADGRLHLPDALDRAARPGRADPHATEVTGQTIAAVLPSIPTWELALRGVIIYAALLVALRLFGKREVGQFTLYDLVFILLVANALQPAITGPDTSLVGGLILIVALVLTNYAVGRLDRLPRFHNLFTP